MTQLRQIVLERDGITDDDFDEIICDILECETNGDGPCSFRRDPDEVLLDYFCIEPDYIFDLFEELSRYA